MSALQVTRLDSLAAEVNRQHGLALQSAMASLRHALDAGTALLEARELVDRGEWEAWLSSNFAGEPRTARQYMRIAHHRDQIPSDRHVTAREALLILRGLPSIDGVTEHPEDIAAEAVALAEAGTSHRRIASQLGVSKSVVGRWTKPAVDNTRTGSQRRRAQRDRAAREALQRVERDKAMRKAGGGVAEAYSLIRKAAQVLDRARQGEENREILAAIDAALARLHAAEDEVVKAVGIS